MYSTASSLSGFFMTNLLLQIMAVTSVMGLDVQINIQVHDTEGFLVECASGGWPPHAEMTWRDSSGNVIAHSSKFDSQDRAGLLHLKRSVLLKNRTHGLVTCCIYHPVTGQEKRRGIFIPDILFKPEYMSLMSYRLPCPVIYLTILLVLHCVRLKDSESKMRSLGFIWEFLSFLSCIFFLHIYLNFRKGVSVLNDVYPMYSTWLSDVCKILTVMMLFFSGYIMILVCTLSRNTVPRNNNIQDPESHQMMILRSPSFSDCPMDPLDQAESIYSTEEVTEPDHSSSAFINS